MKLKFFKNPLVGKIIFLSILSLISIGASLLLYWCVRKTPWAFSDSAAYFSSARNLANGLGLAYFHPNGTLIPLTVFAPLYPLFLSIFALLKIDLILASQIMDVMFFGGLVFLSGYLFEKITSSKFLAICLSILKACSLPLVDNFSSMMSEPLAFLTGFTGFLLLLLFVTKNSPKYLYLSAVLCGASFAARYAFVSFPLAALIVLIAFAQGTRKKKILNTIIYALISLGAMGVWLIIQMFTRASVAGRSIGISELILAKFTGSFKLLFDVLKFWLPYENNMISGVRAHIFKPILLALFLLLVVIGFVLAIRGRKKNTAARVPFVVTTSAIIWFLTYLITFEFTYLFFNYVHIDQRLLLPLLPPIFICLLGSVLMIGVSIRHRNIFTVVVGSLLVLCFFGYNLSPLIKYGRMVNKNPPGYAGPAWRGDVIFERIAQLPHDSVILSNAPDILLFFSNHNAYYVTHAELSDPDLFNEKYQASFAEMMEQNCALMVLMDTSMVKHLDNMQNKVTEADYAQAARDFDVVFSDANGEILKNKACPEIVFPEP